MKIAHIIPYSIVFPLAQPNGRYNWVLQLADLQSKNGNEVTIYGNPGSRVNGVRTIGIPHAKDSTIQNNRDTFQLALENDNDVYHSHFDSLHYEFAHKTKKPIVFTQHWWPSDEVVRLAASASGNVWAVPPTKYMAEYDKAHGIASKGFIHHGIDHSLFKPGDVRKNERLLFVGRISPQKNVEVAIKTSRESGIGLDIIGKISDKDKDYWNDVSSAIDGTNIRYIGTVPFNELAKHYSAAQAVIFPSDINESFGLVAVEAQACGTPIIMKSGGSRGELVRDGVTGFLCNSQDDFNQAARLSATILARECTSFAKEFSIEKMEASYRQLYVDLLSSADS
jgi:glycosyltransferase involved in cell wall biosynthesis